MRVLSCAKEQWTCEAKTASFIGRNLDVVGEGNGSGDPICFLANDLVLSCSKIQMSRLSRE